MMKFVEEVMTKQYEGFRGDVFKDPKGRYRTRSLFWETAITAPRYLTPLYTFKKYDNHGCKSAYNIYMQSNDPLEYEFAQNLVGSWEHYERLIGLDWFVEQIQPWRDELNVKYRAKALKNLEEVASSGKTEASRIAAAKYLAERGWERKGNRGRPTKEEVKRVTKEEAEIEKRLSEDAKRLKVVNDNEF